VRRRPMSAMQVSVPGVGVAILVSPVAWLHYLLLLVPALLITRWNKGIAVGAAVMVIPTVAAFWAFRTLPLAHPELAPVLKATIGSVYSWGALLLVTSMTRANGTAWIRS